MMKYNVYRLLHDIDFEQKVYEEVNMPVIEIYGEHYHSISPVVTEGAFFHEKNYIRFKGTISSEISTICHKCLKKINVKQVFDVDEKFFKIEEAEYYKILNDTIDSNEMITDNLYLQFGSKFLCKNDCNGLCQYCGKDKNTENCNCSENFINPKFEALKDLFNSNTIEGENQK
jgi:Predicted metal-binding, possibly nucleic acid-binding protein